MTQDNREIKDLQDEYFFRLPHARVIADYVWPGVVMAPRRIIEVKDLEFSKDDTIIVTYPKSGTTWMSEVVSAILYRGDTDSLKKIRQDVRVPWLELEQDHWWVKMYFQIDKVLGRQKTTQHKTARAFFTHLPLELLPKSVLQGQCRIIYVGRNPKDNAVSFFHHHRMARFLGVQKNITWDGFFTLYLLGSLYCGSWFEHVLGYWRFSQLCKDRMIFVKYEEMKQNFQDQVKMIAAFMDVELTDSQLQKIVDHCSFNSMKDNKMANRDISWLFDQKISKFMRKGQVGDWKNFFTIAQSEIFDTVYEEKMQGSELNFQFE